MEIPVGFGISEGKHKVIQPADAFTFTDRELQDTLGSFEVADSTSVLQYPIWPPDTTDTGDWQQRQRVVPLQFQPHLPATAGRGQLQSSHFPDPQWINSSLYGGIQSEDNPSFSQVQVPAAAQMQGAPHQIFSNQQMQSAGDLSLLSAMAYNQGDSGQHDMTEGPSKVSHGASEKQRRDRINAMIDKLRKLVPPGGVLQTAEQCSSAAGDVNVLDGKRSKYIVLAESIKFISVLQRQLEQQTAELAQLKGQVEENGKHTTQAGEGGNKVNWKLVRPPAERQRASSAEDEVTGGLDNTIVKKESEAELAESDSPKSNSDASSEGNSLMPIVVVDISPEICYIKVTCSDRRGLLADILNAFAPLPLEVNRAAIATGKDSIVTDIFEVSLDEGCPLGAAEIRTKVQSSLYEANMLCSRGEKKRRHIYFSS